MSPLPTRVTSRVLKRFDPYGAELLQLRNTLSQVAPAGLARLNPEAFVPDRIVGHVGIDMRGEAQLERIERWGLELEPFFADLRRDPLLNRDREAGVLSNPWYPTPDAEIYAGIVLDWRPRRIVEVGAGFSTLIARRSIDRSGTPCELIVVDPEPRTDVAGSADRVVQRPVEELSADDLGLDSKSILFIDSSHIVRARGDVPFLFNELIPTLAPGALVHVHDVFLPYDYPDAYRRRLYAEQYVLHALLADSPRYAVVFATHWMVRTHTDAMRRVFGPHVGSHPSYFGASFWFAVADPQSSRD